MASAPVALGIGGVAAILLISGIQGKSIGSIIQGDFGTSPNPAGPESEGSGVTQSEGPEVVGKTTAASNAKILKAAASQLGVPYRWGGEQEKNGFDCSGLTQWCYAQAGVKIPRTAQEQYNYMRHIKTGTPSSLAFFGSSPKDVSHVGIVTAPGVMIDATHTGAYVEYSTFNPIIGSAWGSDKLIGYGQP
jgi:cell wall-associated NlpC family hydrolase